MKQVLLLDKQPVRIVDVLYREDDGKHILIIEPVNEYYFPREIEFTKFMNKVEVIYEEND